MLRGLFYLLAMILILSSTVTNKPLQAKAACADVYIDNDDPNYYTYPQPGSTWKYVSASTSQRNDHRLHNDSANVRYNWETVQGCSSGFWAFKVYLNSYSFTNTNTRYYKDGSPTYTVNQDTAPGGWTTIENVYLGKNTNYIFSVSATAPVSTQDTGADMIRFTD